MANSFQHALSILLAWDWPAIIGAMATVIGAIATVWLVYIAKCALNTWKKQSKAQKQFDFMDQITDAVHELIGLLENPIAVVRVIKIGIESHSEPSHTTEIESAIKYIKASGKRDAKQLLEHLQSCRQTLFKVRSLAAKGQVYGLTNYEECRQACNMISWQHDRMQSLYTMIGLESWNWENPEVKESLAQVISLDADEMKQQIDKASERFLVFVRDNHQAILK